MLFRKNYFLIHILTFSLFFTGLISSIQAAPQQADYCYLPPFVTDPNTPPNIMIVFDRTTFGMNRAYQESYSNNEVYPGFFDPASRYVYNSTNNYFIKNNSCTPASTNYNCFPGNLLNYALMSSLDLARWAFIGFGKHCMNCSPGSEYTYTGDLIASDAVNTTTFCVSNVSFAGSTYSYQFSLTAPSGTKPSTVSIRVYPNSSTCSGSSVCAVVKSGNKCSQSDLQLKYTDEDRIGLIQKFVDADKDLKVDYPEGAARFGIKRWKKGSGNDKATEIIDDQYNITDTQRRDYFKSLLDTTSSAPPEDNITPELGTMMHDLVNYFSNNSNYTVTSPDNNDFTQSPYNWSKDPAYRCRKNFVLFLTTGTFLNDSTTGGPLSTNCDTNTTLRTDFSQNTCYAFNTDLDPAREGKQNIQTMIVHTVFGVRCESGKCANDSTKTCSTDDDCTNKSKLEHAARVGGGLYLEVRDPKKLKAALEEAILNILANASSASTVATLTTQTRGSSTLTQAYFYPRRPDNSLLKWIGYLRLLWSDTGANLREDTANNAYLDLKLDNMLNFYYDPANNTYRARTYKVKDEYPYLTIKSCDPSDPDNKDKSNEEVSAIWNAQLRLKDANPSETVNPLERNIKIAIGDNLGFASPSNFQDFTTAIASTLQPYWNFASYCTNNPNRWCSQDAHCNYCSSLKSQGIDRGCNQNSDCNYCNGDKTRFCTTTLTCTDPNFTGICTNAGDSCGSGICVGDCYKYYGTCDTSSLVCDVDGTTTCSSAGSTCSVNGITGTCKGKCSLEPTILCVNNLSCIEDYRGTAFSGSACITSDTCSIAPSATCKAECDTACARSVIKYVRGYDNPLPSGGQFRKRHTCSSDADCSSGSCVDGVCSGSDLTKTLKLGDIVYSTPRISPDGPVNGYDIIYKDETYAGFIESNTVKGMTPIVIVGANDGMVHAFKVSKIKDINPPTTDNNGWQISMFVNQPSDTSPPADLGKELWAFIPYNTVPYLRWYCQDDYCHIPMVDARFTVVDASINGDGADSPKDVNSWRRLLVGAMGVGGKKINVAGKTLSSSIFVLDITDPQNPSLLWERPLPDNTLTTSNPAIVRFGEKDKNGEWYLVIGSGPAGVTTNKLEYKSGNAYIYVFDLKTGAVKKSIDTGLSGYAIGDLMAVDMDSDYNVDDIYFGTYKGAYSTQTGDLWRLRIRNNTYYKGVSDWDNGMLSRVVSVGRPIFASPEITLDAKGNIWIYFGTGLYLTLEHAKKTTDSEWIYAFKETEACWKGSGTCSEYSDFYNTTNIYFANAKATEIACFCGGNMVQKLTCSSPGTCPSNPCGPYENLVVLTVKDATIAQDSTIPGDGVPSSCTNKKDEDAISCLENYIIENYNGWKRALPGKKIFSRPFVAGGLADFTAFEPTSTYCSLGGNTHLITLHYTTGTSYIQPTLYLAGGTTGSVNNIKIMESVKLGIGVPPLGESLVALPLQGDTYKVITQVSGALPGTTVNPSVPVKSGYVLWLVK